jgi:hypothetical protein
MTIPSPTEAPLLRTDADVLARVNALVGPACTGRQLWVMLVDGDDRQLPAVLPVAGVPRTPDQRGLHALERLIDGLREELRTDRGPGSVIFALERAGIDAILPPDREWSNALQVLCADRQVALRGVFLSTDSGVRRMTR